MDLHTKVAGSALISGLTLLLTLAACSSTPTARISPVEIAGPPPHDTFFPLGMYLPWERLGPVAQKAGMEKWAFVDKMLADAARWHNNFLWVVNIPPADAAQLCRVAEKHHVRIAPGCDAFIGRRDVRGPDQIAAGVQEAVAAFRQLPAFYGYVLMDEARADEICNIENIRRGLAAADPQHPALVVTMTRDTPAAARQTQLPILVTDCYPFFGPHDPNGPNTVPASQSYYRYVTQKLSGFAQEGGRRAWIMPGCFVEIWGPWHYDAKGEVVLEPGAYWHWRQPTPAEIRWQVWQAIAAGMKGIVFFTNLPGMDDRPSAVPAGAPYPLVHEETATHEGAALLYGDGKPTRQMDALAEAYGVVAPIIGQLTTMQPADFPVAFADPPFTVRTLQDPRTGERLVVVVNDSVEQPIEAKITFLPLIESVTDVRTQRALPLAGDASTSLKLLPGNGTVLTVKPRVGQEAVRLFHEDLMTCGSSRQLDNILIETRPGGWGMGYDTVATPGQASPQQAARAGSLTYDLARIGGALYGGLQRYVIYHGSPSRPGESVILSISKDAQNFSWLAVDAFDKPLLLPADTKAIRFELAPGAWLSGFELLGISGNK